MFKAIKHYFYLIFSVLLSCFALTGTACAALDFSVLPVDGGSTIRFSRGDLNNGVTKEVRVRISSNENIQYQIFQELVSPFTNERGVIIDRPVLQASIMPGSMGTGTAYLSSYEPVNRRQQLLYTSSANGVSEAFTLVYNVDTKYLSDSGSFNGLIQYTIRPVSGGQTETVRANVFIESNAELKITAEGSSGTKLVRLDTRDKDRAAYVNFAFNGNAGSNLRVYQELITYPINDLNLELELGILKTVSEGAQHGDLSNSGAVEIPRNRALVYKSSQQSDSFSILFSLTPDRIAELMAGSYRGVVRYSFETDHGEVKNFDIDLDIKISPIFEIILNFPQGPVSFNGIVPGGDPQIKQVEVDVKTNLGCPYVVKQRVGDLLVNDKGQSIPKKYFVLRQDVENKNSGKPANRDFKSVEPGETEIFYSNSKGSPAKFQVFYRLSPYPEMTAGDYKTSIVYDLGEL
jgi:hypothetical protein